MTSWASIFAATDSVRAIYLGQSANALGHGGGKAKEEPIVEKSPALKESAPQ